MPRLCVCAKCFTPRLVLVLPLGPLPGARPHPGQTLLGDGAVSHRHRRLQTDS